MTVLEKIAAQQKGKENTAAWMVGEQLKDICHADKNCAEIVAQDLEKESMSIEKAEQEIHNWANKQKRNGNCVCVPPNKAEEIIRKFYGLPAASQKEEPKKTGVINLNLDAFI